MLKNTHKIAKTEVFCGILVIFVKYSAFTGHIRETHLTILIILFVN